MNALITTDLTRLETSLNTLIASIESYSPSIPAAVDLLDADTALQHSAQLLHRHQANHARILFLRSQVESQNQQITSTLQLLANTRKELIDTPVTDFGDERQEPRKVDYHELLDYARRISRYTVPPRLRDTDIEKKKESNKDARMTNGGSPSRQFHEAAAAPAVTGGDDVTREGDHGIGVSALEQNEVQWLNPMAQSQFVPWPSEEAIRRGALAQIQFMMEQGVDPSVVGVEAANEAAKTEEMDSVKKEQEMEDIEMGGQSLGEVVMEENRSADRREDRREERREEKPKVFKGLDLDQDSDDE